MSRSISLLVSAIFVLFSLGLLMVFNTTSAEMLDKSLISQTHQALFRQLAYGGFGILLGGVFYSIGYERLLRYSPFALGICVMLLLAVFFPPIGLKINGARRWIQLFGATFQPSELAKFVIPCYFIHRVTTKEKASFTFPEFLHMMIWMALPIFLILMEPDNGTTALIVVTLVVLFFIAKVPWKYWALPCLIFGSLGVGLIVRMPHVTERLKGYMYPEQDLRGRGHQPHQAKIAAGSGGLLGKGVGESLQKLSYLPAARSDYIAAIYAEEFGFLGICILIVLYMLITYAGFQIALGASHLAACYLATTITFLLAFQAFLNLGVVSNLLPSKGTTLPFFSQGGSSLLVNFCALFLLLSIAKHSKRGAYVKKKS